MIEITNHLFIFVFIQSTYLFILSIFTAVYAINAKKWLLRHDFAFSVSNPFRSFFSSRPISNPTLCELLSFRPVIEAHFFGLFSGVICIFKRSKSIGLEN